MSDTLDKSNLRAGRKLFTQPCEFFAGTDNVDALPPIGLQEVAFAGRSNVGKSSLLNALTGRTTLARVSHTPGRTQQLNFFNLGGRLVLVDLPGFGYARTAKTRVRDWTGLIERYLRGRPTLRRVLMLIDARRGPMTTDRRFMAKLDAAAVSYQVVLTKCDELGPEALAARTASLADELRRHVGAHPDIVATSARNGRGIPELRATLAALVTKGRFD